MKTPALPPTLGRRVARLFAPLVALLLLVHPAAATWSLVVINTRTREVAIASATCLESLDLARALAVMRVGEGGGVSQGLIDFGLIHRKIIWNGLVAGDTPDQIILDVLAGGSLTFQRQFGVAAFSGPPANFSGGGLGRAFFGTTGTAGELQYAIQGNVITGSAVVLAAESALVSTPGDLSQKMMAAMDAARAMGGDGRCSCTTGAPDSCGTPPPGFVKSAHVAFLYQSRIGDKNGQCVSAAGCATGDYYIELQFSGGISDPDPVLELQNLYNVWRAGISGRPDHILSTATPSAPRVVADGVTTTNVHVRLVDVDGVPLTAGGATLAIATEDGGAPIIQPGPVVDNGDGTYDVGFQATTIAGTQRFVITADDGVAKATLFPFLELTNDPLTPLHIGVDELSVGAGGAVPFVLNLGGGMGGLPYVLLGSLSGTSPGIDLGGSAILPLNQDAFLVATLGLAGSPILPGTIGTLDSGGRAEASLSVPPGLMSGFVGLHADWAAVGLGVPLITTGPVGLDFLP